MQHLVNCPKKNPFQNLSTYIWAQVRFLAYHRIKPHAPPLVRAPVNSFEFQSCDRTPQVDHLSLSLSRWLCIANNEWSSFTAWTTRVSNPVCSPRFRVSASVDDQKPAFAIGVPPDIYTFHRFTWSSNFLFVTQAIQYFAPCRGWALILNAKLKLPPTHPLHPVIPDNACHLRITAAAGT